MKIEVLENLEGNMDDVHMNANINCGIAGLEACKSK